MMDRVPSYDESQGAHGEEIAARRSASLPGVCRQVTDESQGGQADLFELGSVLRPRNRVGVGRTNSDVLLEAWQRRVESSRKPQGAEDENPLAVVDVTPHLANTPLSGRIAVE